MRRKQRLALPAVKMPSQIRKMKVARVVEWQTRQASDSKNGHFRASKNIAQHTQKRLSKNNLRLVKFNTRL
jgi:predicted lipid carrier protein YhbT